MLVDNEISKEELDELTWILNQAGNASIVHNEMSKIWEDQLSDPGLNENLYSKIVADPRFLNSGRKNEHKNLRLVKLKHFLNYAAVLLLVAGLSLTLFHYKNKLFNNDRESHLLNVNNNGIKQNDSKHVVLTLSNGEKVIVDEGENVQLRMENNAVVSKVNGGQLIYNSNPKIGGTADKLRYNTVSTPVGGDYQLVLSDGTKVWLNAKSSLKFPVLFNSVERNVELIGEGYFDVAHEQARPFKVLTKNMNVQVMGTRFNISAYHDDDVVRTSLIEGSVMAENKMSSAFLKPGQQAVLVSGTPKIKVGRFDETEVLDWKNGYFIFRNQPIAEIMKKVSRWYHIDVNYQDSLSLSKEEFGGKYLKSNSLPELLSSLELTGTVHFKVNGRRVTVMP